MAVGNHPSGDLFKHEKRRTNMPYEVQHKTLTDGWVNTWLYHEGDGIFRAETFDTEEEAEAALDEHLQDLEEEFRAGNIGRYDRDEFRVRRVPAVTQH
jgi:hypothetical protein